MRSIVLLGVARSGKSSAAQYLSHAYNYTPCGIAFPAKRALGRWVQYSALNADNYLDPLDVCEALKPALRPALQAMQTALVRLSPHNKAILVQDLITRQRQAGIPVVVEDCRMPWEAEAFLDAGWAVVKITRPGAGLDGGSADHDTERLVDDCRHSYVLPNRGSLDDMYRLLDAVVSFEGAGAVNSPGYDHPGGRGRVALGEFRRHMTPPECRKH